MNSFDEYKNYDLNLNDIVEKLTTKSEEFKKKIDNNDDSIYWNFSGIWGVSFKDISNLDLSSFTAQQLSRVSFSTLTKFPEKSKLPKGFDPKTLIKKGLNSLPNDIKKLHKEGIDGSGVVVAVIDKYNSLKHKEFDGIDITVVKRSRFKEDEADFHGLCVSAALCGKNIGVAPKSKVLFYPTVLWTEKNKDHYTKLLYNDILACLDEILKRLESGEKIDIVSISGGFNTCRPQDKKDEPCEEEIKYQKLRKALLKYGCTVITSKEFWDNGFNYAHKIDNLKDINDLNNYKECARMGEDRINFLCGGKAYPLIGTKNEYIYDGGLGSASWSIPLLSGVFALSKQIDPDLSFDDFVKAALSTSVRNKDGVNFVNAYNLCKTLKQENERSKTHALQNL